MADRSGHDRGAPVDPPWATPVTFEPQALPIGRLEIPRAPSVHLWYLDLGSLWASLASVLGDEEAAGADGDPMTVAQLRFARRFYLRMLLGAYLDVPGKDVTLLRGPRGKPILDASRHGEDIHFSLSKSGERLLIGISGAHEIGVDLELRHRKPRNARALSRRFFTDSEAGAICGLDPEAHDAAFMRTWACKEAVAKASGHGIANRFCRFTVNPGLQGPPRVEADEDHSVSGWQLALLVPDSEFIAAVAARQSDLSIEAFRL